MPEVPVEHSGGMQEINDILNAIVDSKDHSQVLQLVEAAKEKLVGFDRSGMQTVVRCPVCDGHGTLLDVNHDQLRDVCRNCKGTGVVGVRKMADQQEVMVFTGKCIHDIHLEFVEMLKARGEHVVQPRGMPMGHIDGYDKTIGLISAGSIYKGKDGTFSLLPDRLTHAYADVKWDDIGLCDSRCWYEAIEDKRLQDAKKEQAEKQAAILPRVELIPRLKQEHVIEILSGLIDEFHYMNRIEDAHIDDKNKWKQDFLEGLKVPVEIKKMLGYKEK